MKNNCIEGRGVRAGLSRVELAVLLAVVAIVVVVAWPVIRKPFANRRLYAAADLVRSELNQARSEAMRSGHTYAFRYVPDGDRFSVRPHADAAESLVKDAATTAPEGDSASAEAEASSPVHKALPEGVKFVVNEAAADAAAPAAAAPDAEADAPAETDASWSEPILFYPDGTTSDAHLVLGTEWGSAMAVTLRGMTGVVVTGEVTANGE